MARGLFDYDDGAVAVITATPASGYRFDGWVGDVVTVFDANMASTTITMSADYSITASFEQEESDEEWVYFACPNLEAAIKEAIDKPEGVMYPSDLEGLTSLDAEEMNMSDLTGVEHCTELTWLCLGSNEIRDISPLEGLTNLTWLNLFNNQIDDIASLESLTNLTGLLLSGNKISDVKPLVDNLGLDAGEVFWLSDNPPSGQSVKEYVPALEARGESVDY